jgi:hypothetical protein
MMISSQHLGTRKLSQRFRTKGEVRSAFREWNKLWGGRWRMRVVALHDGGYVGVVRIRRT